MILLIDNYDSFTFNLYQYLGELGAEIEVYRNDEISVEEVGNRKPSGIVISPGPGRPEQAGICIDVIRKYAKSIPILGICLGHQSIGAAFGGTIVHAPELFHGKTSMVHNGGTGLFQGLNKEVSCARYHSLIVEKQTLPDCFEITAWINQQIIMGIRHREYDVEGIQFHPESIMTDCGKTILGNFLKRCGKDTYN